MRGPAFDLDGRELYVQWQNCLSALHTYMFRGRTAYCPCALHPALPCAATPTARPIALTPNCRLVPYSDLVVSNSEAYNPKPPTSNLYSGTNDRMLSRGNITSNYTE